MIAPGRLVNEKHNLPTNLIKAIAISAGHPEVKISRAKLILSNVGKSGRDQFSPYEKRNQRDEVPSVVRQILSDVFSMPVQDSNPSRKNSDVTLGNLIFSDYWHRQSFDIQSNEIPSSSSAHVARATSPPRISSGVRRTTAPARKSVYFSETLPNSKSQKANMRSDNIGRHTKSPSPSRAVGFSSGSIGRIPSSMMKKSLEVQSTFPTKETSVPAKNSHHSMFDDTLLSETDNTFSEDVASSSDNSFDDTFIPKPDDDIFHRSHMTRPPIPPPPLVLAGSIPLQCVMSCGPTCPYCIVL
ncbi:unnamed protein product [Meganyctiphanes norvegica]|uniref:Uncharacterized protein n=1 Tax=Meganyctiphanes norvegica TaxID=48144 RepID=A0AAV2Q2Q3_MEGNR